MKPQWAGPEHCASLEATLGSLEAAPLLGSTYAYGPLEHKRHGLPSQAHELRVCRCRILPRPTLSWDLRNKGYLKGYLFLLCLPRAYSPGLARGRRTHRDTCLLHHTGLYLAAQPGQPGRW